MTFRGHPEEIANLKIGDVLYNFDGNRRAYRPGIGGPPIYEKHFEAIKIVGETKQSWVMERYQTKVNKRTLESACHFADRGYFTKHGMEADIWLNSHRHKIIRTIEQANFEQLQKIADIMGYVPNPGTLPAH